MNILDVALAGRIAASGGGGGTDDYENLNHLPQINDVTLAGNKTSESLGLQSEITNEDPLDADLVDDTTSDNKFVTSTEKNTWNAKQNAIDADHKISADYVDDSTSTNKFVTASDKEAWNAKQSAIDSDHKLSSSLVSFTTAEAAALDSGIDSSKVGQISTNQTNILYALNTGVKNLIVMSELSANYHGITVNRTPKGITISGTADADISLGLTGTIVDTGGQDPKLYSMFSQLPNSVKLTGAPDSQQKNRIIVALYNDATWVYSFSSLNDMPQDLSSYTYNRWYAYISIANGTSYSGTWYPMLKDASISDDTFVPGALPNYDLTRLESEDRAGLIDVVDSGAKNLLDISQATFGNKSKVTFNADGSVTGNITEDARIWGWDAREFTFTLPAGTYCMHVDVTGGSNNNWGIQLRDSSNNTYGLVSPYAGSTAYFTLTTSKTLGFIGKIFDRTLYIMLCTKAAFGVSPKFVPYRMSYQDLCDKKAPTLSGNMTSGSLDDITANSYYICSNTVTGMPDSNKWAICRTDIYDSATAIQHLTYISDPIGKSFIRVKERSEWRTWLQITNA